MTTNNQTATSNVKATTEQPKAKLVKGTKKNQAPYPCRPLYNGG